MDLLSLHELHASLGAVFGSINGVEMVEHYGDPSAEYRALRESAAVFDLGFRGRFCLTGADRVRLLHGQVTNDVQGLKAGQGCYTAVVTNKGRMQCDAFVYALPQELLLDVEPGVSTAFRQRLEHHIIADDVQVVDAAPYYGLLSVQGPRAAEAVAGLELGIEPPASALGFSTVSPAGLGEIYLVNQPRIGLPGFEMFVPTDAQGMVHDRLLASAKAQGGCGAGWSAFELARIEAAVPRFGVDMDESNLPPEAGIEGRAVSLDKGCYIGQEILARLRTYGQVTRALRGLRIDCVSGGLPVRGDKLRYEGRDVGQLTSVAWSDSAGGAIALGYVRRECFRSGTELLVASASRGELRARIVDVPFVR
ncbi:MAG: aminomethyl transferase family protein [Verrucomicrobia bacterium]|nr:MAG: aminomethyl transferase family protein [Verrucomicrobiota bacterium]